MFYFFERSVTHLSFVVLSFARVLNLLFLHEGSLLLAVFPELSDATVTFLI